MTAVIRPPRQEAEPLKPPSSLAMLPAIPVITATRLLLRPLADADVPALFEQFSDPEITRFWSSPPLVTIADAQTLLDEINDEFQRGELLEWGLERLDTPGVIGTCALSHLDLGNRRGEIGFSLRRNAWGNGYMSEMLPVLVDYAFTDLGLHRLEADVDPRNAASIRLLEGLGFRQEGHLRERWRITGDVQDSLIFGLLEPEWASRQHRR